MGENTDLSNMDSSSRVGDITSSSSRSRDGRDGGRGSASNVQGGRGGDVGVASDDRGSSHNGGSSISISTISSIATISGISKTVSTIEVGVSLPLGNMDSSGRVGNITSSSSRSGDGRDSSRGTTSNAQGGRGGDLGVASDDRGSSHNRGSSIAVSTIASIATISCISKTISTIEVGVSLPLSNMDSSGRVGNITSSSSRSRDGRHSSRGTTSNAQGGRGGDLGVASDDRGSSHNGSSSIAISSIAGVSQAIVSKHIRISLPLGNMDSSRRVGDIASSS